MSIRSPLGALGALMILLQGIAAAALVPLQSQPDLQLILVRLVVGVTSILTSVVVIVVLWFAFKNPGLLFSPRDIDPRVHVDLYRPDIPTPVGRPSIPPGVITFEVTNEGSECQQEERE